MIYRRKTSIKNKKGESSVLCQMELDSKQNEASESAMLVFILNSTKFGVFQRNRNDEN